MKYVAFTKPEMAWDGYDWLYNLIEDRKSNDYDFFLVEAKTPEKARELVVNAICKKDIREHGHEMLVDVAYKGFCDLEFGQDEDILQILGPEDGQKALQLYQKYSYEAFYNDEVDFTETLSATERKLFYSFSKENIETLYKKRIYYDILVMPITKELKDK